MDGRTSRIIDCIVSVICVIALMITLDVYLMTTNLNYGYFIIGDAVVLGVWIYFAWHATTVLDTPAPHERQVVQTDLWTAMLPWALFKVLHIAKLFCIYYYTSLDHPILGPGGLSLALYANIPTLYVVLVGMHHNVKPFCKRGLSLKSDTGEVAIDLIDILELLTIIWGESAAVHQKLPKGMEIFVFVYCSLLLVILPILALHDCRYSVPMGEDHSVPYSIVYHVFSFLTVNLAGIIIRLINWLAFQHLSAVNIVLLGKNFVGLFLGARYLVMYFSKMGPKKCPSCNDRFSECEMERHERKCKRKSQVSYYFQSKSTKAVRRRTMRQTRNATRENNNENAMEEHVANGKVNQACEDDTSVEANSVQ